MMRPVLIENSFNFMALGVIPLDVGFDEAKTVWLALFQWCLKN